MKVRFRNNYLIYRTSVEGLAKIIIETACNDGTEEDAIKKLQIVGWTSEEVHRFDEEWGNALEIEDVKILKYSDVYRVLRENVDLDRFWCMK